MMSKDEKSNQAEDPRKRFRRLLEEAERAEKEATIPLETGDDTSGRVSDSEEKPKNSFTWKGDEEKVLNKWERSDSPGETTRIIPIDELDKDGETTSTSPQHDFPPRTDLGDTPRVTPPRVKGKAGSDCKYHCVLYSGQLILQLAQDTCHTAAVHELGADGADLTLLTRNGYFLLRQSNRLTGRWYGGHEISSMIQPWA